MHAHQRIDKTVYEHMWHAELCMMRGILSTLLVKGGGASPSAYALSLKHRRSAGLTSAPDCEVLALLWRDLWLE